MKIVQKLISLPAKPRGFHLVTSYILQALPELEEFQAGLCHLFLMHTSASLTINENADPSVRSDFLKFTNALVPEDFPYSHTLEGSDDMPAHIKGSLYGNQLTIPVHAGKLVLGTWQGIYLCEHRDFSSNRKIYITLMGE
jgi:secondary thiamine-phosphate synthase enzyme